MAGPSSEAGYENIGTAENSSHPEIEPEIEAVEATGDSEEVCGLERKECGHIMEHLKNNPGLFVQSLGPEGRIVLHEAIMADETQKPKAPDSKCAFKGLSEADVGSEWYRALDSGDCKALMALLKDNPCLVAQTGPEGRTVLHAAAGRGCVELVGQVLDLFKGRGQFVDEMSGVKVALDDLLDAKWGPQEATAHDVAGFTCPPEVREAMAPHRWSRGSFPEFSPDASQHLKDTLVEIMEREPSKEAFEVLKDGYEEDLDYNFVLDRKELRFHYACQVRTFGLNGWQAEEYMRSVIRGCLELEPSESKKVLTYLFQLHNAQGQTPIHAASVVSLHGLSESPHDHNYKGWEVRGWILQDDAYKGLNGLNVEDVKDVRGWTALHHAVCEGYSKKTIKLLLDGKQVDVNARTPSPIFALLLGGMTALHLAILHNNAKNVKLLLECSRIDVNALLYRPIEYGYGGYGAFWSPLQLATIMGLSDVVRALLELKRWDIFDDGLFQYANINNDKLNFLTMAPDERGKFKIPSSEDRDMERVSALLFASASGNPSILQLFLDDEKFNPLVKFQGATALHYATNAMIPKAMGFYDTNRDKSRVGRFLFIEDFKRLHHIDAIIGKEDGGEEELKGGKLIPTSYLGRKACITMLLQAGVDIWEKDDQKRFAEPGPQASEEIHLWWYEKMAQETLEAKKSLNDAANAISVVAALVATTSFVGPLQPPLGYGGDSVDGGVQDTYLSIRVFMVSNILSFYLAIASIMFAVVPSLPMPQEGIYAEWQRTRRTVGVAIFFLLMSVLCVLISFGAASNSVVSEDYSWQHLGLSFYPRLLGGFICILGIGFFFLRLLRLVFNRNAKIRYLYKTFIKF